MKRIYAFLLALAVLLGMAACEKDNFEPPKSLFEGRLVYQGEPILVQSANVGPGVIADFPVFIELWQAAYNNRTSIRLPIGQDGKFSALLFDGEYKVTVPNNQGPFLWKKTSAGNPDSLVVNLSGSKTMDIEVMPYYMLRNPSFSVNGRKITGSLKIEKIITDANAKNVERVFLYVNKSQFVDAGNNLSTNKTELAGTAITDLNAVSLTTAEIPALVPTQNYLYVRIGVKMVNVDDLIYTPVSKVTL